MPGLTVTEKEHWKERITRRIDQRIETLAAAEPNLLDRMQCEARQRALESLNLATWQTELDALKEQRDQWDKRERQIHRAMLAQVRGVPVDDLEEYGYHRPDDVTKAVTRRQKVHEDDLLAEHPLGRQILRLREEKECLLDTVWLATCPREVRALWEKVNALLNHEPTQLERDALAIPPAEAD